MQQVQDEASSAYAKTDESIYRLGALVVINEPKERLMPGRRATDDDFWSIFASYDVREAAWQLFNGVWGRSPLPAEDVVSLLLEAARLNLDSMASNRDDPELCASYREHATECREVAEEFRAVFSLENLS
jgi:hypothetical protein